MTETRKARGDEAAELLMELAALASPSLRERRVADLVSDRLRHLGLEVSEDAAGRTLGGESGNLVCRVPGIGSGPALTLAAHLDTVEPSGPLRPVREDGVIRNAGGTILGADNKAAVAALIVATRSLLGAGEPFPSFELVFTVAEEVGVKGARELPADIPSAPLAVVFDSAGPVGGVVTRAPSQHRVTAEFEGVSAHAGLEPEKGVSAIQAAAKAIAAMDLGRLDEETTANVGVIEGGVAENIVPDRCVVRSECRSHDEQRLARVTASMVESYQAGAAAVGADVTVTVSTEYRAFNLEHDEPAVRLAVGSLEALGIEPRFLTSGGGSDANEFNLRGVPTVNLDCGMMDVHSPREHVHVSDLERLVDVIEAMIRSAPPIGGDAS